MASLGLGVSPLAATHDTDEYPALCSANSIDPIHDMLGDPASQTVAVASLRSRPPSIVTAPDTAYSVDPPSMGRSGSSSYRGPSLDLEMLPPCVQDQVDSNIHSHHNPEELAEQLLTGRAAEAPAKERESTLRRPLSQLFPSTPPSGPALRSYRSFQFTSLGRKSARTKSNEPEAEPIIPQPIEPEASPWQSSTTGRRSRPVSQNAISLSPSLSSEPSRSGERVKERTARATRSQQQLKRRSAALGNLFKPQPSLAVKQIPSIEVLQSYSSAQEESGAGWPSQANRHSTGLVLGRYESRSSQVDAQQPFMSERPFGQGSRSIQEESGGNLPRAFPSKIVFAQGTHSLPSLQTLSGETEFSTAISSRLPHPDDLFGSPGSQPADPAAGRWTLPRLAPKTRDEQVAAVLDADRPMISAPYAGESGPVRSRFEKSLLKLKQITSKLFSKAAIVR
ncbi:uncharacterized protein BJ171DRAFT_512730 [Polychytrium aggregatum]|uniref:uncharacterized protein n=1 Tax=Polychytrium aggregatum TaxID=110093 RepID=UPI0022FE8A5B|nr:uncharacterized protein BJ171DRAFT_512730 [Polychytrium aggregatum]KAI9202623.1 hypothetical protein BJ171DRAFT_512730 [Polychytrium aggregatum]